MRLLHVKTLEFLDSTSRDERPTYIVASHRWATGQEATFKDVRERTNTESAGYQKIEAFARFIRENIPGIEWLWIDTCCIDKDSAAELSEAVNSMFRWYREAVVCIAHLADVAAAEDQRSFEQSQWFRRGWTLQELLAPSLVIFTTSRWEVIGHKGSLTDSGVHGMSVGPDLRTSIARITKVPEDVLRDYTASISIGVEEKMRWMNDRRTTREEDMSYALFGIVGVAPGANYGEGRDHARQRLRAALQVRDDMTAPGVERLHIAIHEGDIATFRRLLWQKVDVSGVDDQGSTPLHVAVSHGREKMLSTLLGAHAPINAADGEGQTPLHKAMLNSHFSLARKLLQEGADAQIEDDNGKKPGDLVENPFLSRWYIHHGLDIEAQDAITGNTALIQAAREGDLDGIISLKGLHANVRAQNKSGSTALAEACMRGYTTVIRVLLDYGADANATDHQRWSPFTRCIWAHQEEALNLLLEHDGASIEIDAPYTSDGMTPLMQAIYGQQWSMVTIILRHGANPNMQSPEGRSPLRRVCQLSCREDLVQMLIDYKANVNTVDPDGWTALAEAIHHRSWSVVEVLLKHNARPDCLVYDQTVLTTLLADNYPYPVEPKILRRLVECGAPVDATAKGGFPPLHFAIKWAHASSVDELLALGADPNRPFTYKSDEFYQHDHITPLIYMVARSHEGYGSSFRQIMASLLQHGARMEDRDSSGWTALRFAVEKGYDDVACFLVLKGADTGSVGHDGQTPLKVAKSKSLPQLNSLTGGFQ